MPMETGKAMANPATERYPFTAFNFMVEITVPGVSEKVCSASFAECDGLEMTHDFKTIRSGGANDHAYRVPGIVN